MNKDQGKHKPPPTGRLGHIDIAFLALFLILNACVAQKEPNIFLPAPYIAQVRNGLIYDASFHYKDFHASGLLVLKRVQPSTYHVALLSKFGPTIMEFKLDKKGITWIKAFDKLDKKAIENFIARDFRIILLSVLESPEKVKQVKSSDKTLTYKVKDDFLVKLKVNPETNHVVYAENKGFLNLFKTKAKFIYKDKDIPQNIVITHNNINLRIDLNLLKINHAER